ncbi:MAG: hypothetical protein LRY73_08130 [Bacillus sp. (in: Bacteria)]|nr:hypothetical protein [Bacillus sp. (in: firmicutes)]
MYISYNDIEYYHTFHQAAQEALETVSYVFKTGTFFISHIDNETFSTIKVLEQDGVDLPEGIRMPLNEAY